MHERLIEKPNCGMACLKAGDRPSCGCDQCTTYAPHFYKSEKFNRGFTDEDLELINSAWDNVHGYLGPDGCKLPRHLMPVMCLRYRCKKYKG